MLCTNKAFIMQKKKKKNILVPIRANETSQDPILLNDVAASIWEEAEKEVRDETVLQRIIKLYGLLPGSPEAAAVKSFIDQLIDIKLLSEEV